MQGGKYRPSLMLAPLGLFGLLVLAEPAFADCKDEVRELREEITDDRSDYTMAARAEAQKHLAAAELTLLQPLECRANLRQARRALRGGER